MDRCCYDIETKTDLANAVPMKRIISIFLFICISTHERLLQYVCTVTSGINFHYFLHIVEPFSAELRSAKISPRKKGKTYHQRALLTHTANDGNDDGWFPACENQGKETGNLHASSWL